MDKLSVQTVLAHLAAGHSIPEAAAKAGRHPSTIRKWEQRGNRERTRLEALGIEDVDALDVDDPRVLTTERAYFAFVQASTTARGSALADIVSTLYTASTTGLETEEVKLTIRIDPETGDEEVTGRQVTRRTVRDLKVATWLLERLDPDRYHLAQALQLSGPNGEPLQIAGMTEQQATALATILRTYTDGIMAELPPRTRARLDPMIPDLLQAAFESIIPKEIEPA